MVKSRAPRVSLRRRRGSSTQEKEEGKEEEGCLSIIKHIGWQTLKSSGLHQLNASCDFDKSVSLALSLMFSCFSGVIVITDGVTSVPDVAVCETLLNQLRSGTVACSFVQVRTFKD